MEHENQLPHRLTVDECSHLTLTGASEILRFDDSQVEAVTARGTVTVVGSGLKLRCLSLDEGTLVVDGEISGIVYDAPVRRRGLFR